MQAPRARDAVAAAAARPRPPEPRPGQPHHAAGERTLPVRPPPSYRRPPPYEDAAERALPVRPPPPSRPVPPPYYDEEERVLPVRPPSPSRRVVLPPYYDAAERALPLGPLPVRGRSSSSSSSALASCLMAAAFLLLAVGGAGTALFLLFRPHPPDIAVAAVRLPAFAAANGTVAFTFEQRATVRNPNRAPLAHFDSSLRVAYAGGELGSVYIPAGLIDSGRTKDMSASFVVPAFAAATPVQPQQMAASAQQLQQPPVMEVDSLLVVKGKVTVLRLLTHRVEASKVCRVGVSPLDGRVLGFRC